MIKPVRLFLKLVTVSTILCTSVSFFACRKQNPVAFQLEGKSVLSIGNSLTYTNDSPGMLSGMIKQAHIANEGIESITAGGFGFQDHWEGAKGINARKAMGERHWKIVGLQQGPSATEGRSWLLEYSRKCASAIKKINARGISEKTN